MDALLNVPCGQGPRGDCDSDAMRPGWQLVRDGDASEDGTVLPGERHICYSSSLALEMETPAQTDASPQGVLPRRGEREAEASRGVPGVPMILQILETQAVLQRPRLVAFLLIARRIFALGQALSSLQRPAIRRTGTRPAGRLEARG